MLSIDNNYPQNGRLLFERLKKEKGFVAQSSEPFLISMVPLIFKGLFCGSPVRNRLNQRQKVNLLLMETRPQTKSRVVKSQRPDNIKLSGKSESLSRLGAYLSHTAPADEPLNYLSSRCLLVRGGRSGILGPE